MAVVTRFAPSPTGILHVGGARTALFNWLFARHHGGTFLLRIEDTDRQRSTQEAVDAIFDGLAWLNLDWDGDVVSQYARQHLHQAAAERLLAEGKAYRCYASQEDLAAMRDAARAEGRPMRYDGRWRDRDPAEAPAGVDPVIRFKAPQTGETCIDDLVQGPITVANSELDDMVLLRADASPTYMLAVVVDDHDMEITHVIRGNDHLTNTFRQYQLYRALGWEVPQFAHVPLIHGVDGAKLSKRHGALGVATYRDDGFLPEAMNNYLLRLGWGHGDDEVISREDAIQWFDIDGVGRAPARLDLAKLTHLNGIYLRQADDRTLTEEVMRRLRDAVSGQFAEAARERILRAMPRLKERAKTLRDLAESARFLACVAPIPLSKKARSILDGDARRRLTAVSSVLENVDCWEADRLEESVRSYVAHTEPAGTKLQAVAQPLRAALTGEKDSLPIFDVMSVLGRAETLARIGDAVRLETTQES